ncbi:hypothetical protein [Aeromonas hydrophila]|uniref:hypothetical protein n=1 Tax=Aeromonas hydrophila TaxID=644 RepID=UPI0021E6938E|nr:hypothetical protein [Aeromonas hydrophila]MCV3277120.1 hypothetical protein [Aeromonas hydrophila]
MWQEKSEVGVGKGEGGYIFVTMHRQGIGNKEITTSNNAIKEMAAKMQDGAEPHLPVGKLHAVAWLVTATSEPELAAKLGEVCAVLPLSEWCSTLRRLTAENNLMAQPTAAMVPRWKADDPLIWDPLRRHLLVSAARSALQQSEGNSPSPDSTRAKLAALTDKRTARIAELDAELATKPSLAGKLWSWHGYGDPASLAAQLQGSDHPDHSHAVGALLLSPEQLIYWQELTQ